MALTKGSISPQFTTVTGSADATATANETSPPGVTRQERIANQAEVAASGSGANAAAFIDGDSIKGAKTL